MSFHISKIHFDILIHSYSPSIATGFPMHSIFLYIVDLMDLLCNQEKKIIQQHLSRSRDILSFTNQYIL